MKRLVLIPFVFATLLLTNGCGSSSGSGSSDEEKNVNQFSVDSPVYANDLAFLFPLGDNNRPQPFVTIGGNRDIPGRGNFNRIMQAAEAEDIFLNDTLTSIDNWVMVSWRYNACEFAAGTENPCHEQIRFVFQPMDQSGNGAFLDYSMHVVYEYKQTESIEPSDIMAAVYGLRQHANGKTDNKALGVHPVLVDRTDRLAYFNAIRNNVWEPFVFNRNPKLITFMGLGNDGQGGVNLGQWRFITGDIDSTGQWVQTSLPVSNGESVEILTAEAGVGLTTNIDDNGEFNVVRNGRPVPESAAAGALVPHVSNDHNTNCASCHVVDNQIIRNGSQASNIDQFDNETFVSLIIQNMDQDEKGFKNNLVSNQFKSGFWSTNVGIPQTGPVAPQDEVVTRMFGYMHSEPVISQRMAFDNGMAVNQMNKAIRMDARAEELSFRSCTDFSQKANVMLCLFEGNFNTSLDDCLIRSCQ